MASYTKNKRNMIKKFDTEWAGKKLEIETGRFAGQANSSCTVRYGDTVVLATAVMSKEPREGVDFLPLSVEYEEKMYAAGKIKGSRFIKREGRPTDEAVLTGRFIDRALRPLFDDSIRNDIQIVLTVLSIDQENDPDIPALVAASCALSMSDIPWAGPIAAIRVGQINDEWVLNPSYEAREKSIIELSIAGTPERVIMIEASADQVPEETFVEAFAFGQKHFSPIIKLIEEVTEACGKEKIVIKEKSDSDEEGGEKTTKEDREKIIELTKKFVDERIQKAFYDVPKASKVERKIAIDEIKAALDESMKEQQIGKDKRKIGLNYVYEYIEEIVGLEILKNGKRVDGRKLNEVRELKCDVSLLPRVHGSGLFSRGATQALTVVTLGSPGDEQTLDGMEVSGTKRYMHHYNFPPFSVGETGRLGGPGRREIGHGALAEKALLPVIPSKEEFPYTIRVVSETLSSNGSSSMASTCGSTLALMDAGVPIKEPVAGIAMGMASDENGNYKIITDIQDLEDSPGGMDFKIAGTKNGITAIQMDTKTHGITPDMIHDTLTDGKTARLTVLEAITHAIPEPRKEMSPYAPRIITIHINPDKIRDVIGPGGKVINEIIEKTGVSIDIEQDGSVFITSTAEEGSKEAIEWIESLTEEVEVGKTYKGKVVRLMDFGAFVEILPNQDGLVHISEMAPWRVDKVTDVVNIDDEVLVKVVEIDDQGRVNLSMTKAAGYVPPARPAGAQSRGFGRPGAPGRSNGSSRGGRPGGDRKSRGGFFKKN